MRVAWLTIDRLRSGRDIRLSTATMRALNLRRPRSTSIHRLVVPRTILYFLLLLCVFHEARARSVPHDDDDDVVVAGQVHGEILETKVSDPNPDGAAKVAEDVQQETRRKSLVEKTYIGHEENVEDDADEGKTKSEKEILAEGPERIQIEAVGDEGSVAKKRRRNDVTLPGKSILQASEDVQRDVAQKDEGIRRFDARVETDESEGVGQRKADDVAEDILDSQKEDIVDHQRRLTDVKQSPADAKYVDAKHDYEGGARPEGEKYGEAVTDLRERLGDVASSEQAETVDLNEEGTEEIKNLAGVNLDEARIEKIDGVNEEIRNDLRSYDENKRERNQEERVAEEDKKEIDVKDLDLNREDRHLTGASGKSKYKSSTVYLNAEERNSPGREQESIVDGQIKKLISIRNDALESVGDSAKKSEKLDEEAIVSEKSIEVDAVAAEKDEIRNQRSSDAKETSVQGESLDQPSSTTEIVSNRYQKWKEQAAMLQEQVKNGTYLQYLREHVSEVLPDIPKFTENQLLDTVKNIVLSRSVSLSNETYSGNLNATAFNNSQLEIIKCAEQLLEINERQSFVSNVGKCIRGLSVVNCMRIFVWPIVLDYLPESVRENLNNLPIEVNLIDLFQGVRAKSARSESNVHRPRLLTPEYVVFNILKGTLDSKATYDQAPTYIDLRNETLNRLLTIGQLQILQMAEKLLPGEIRREYSDRMFSCVRRFEYFSCVKYFAWPMVKQYHPALPAFPDYQAWYPSLALYPQYPIVPFPSFVETTGELPEIVEADATRMRKPEAVIVNILQNTLKEHAKVPPPSVAHNADSYVALIPPEQLLSIHMAEQLLPTPYRPEFLQKTVKCIQEYNYVTCIKYSTWPTVKQFNPTLPDLSGWLPDWQLPDFFGYLPELPSLPDFSSFIPGLGSGGTTEQPPQSGGSTTQEPSSRFPTILFRQTEISPKTSSELENKITEILTRTRNSVKASPGNPSISNVIVLTTISEKQANILKLAESIVPPPAQAPLVAQVLACLQNNDFFNCTRYVIWPTVALYVPNFPEFPNISSNQEPQKQENQQTPLKDKNTKTQQITREQQEWDKSQNAANPNIKIISRTKFPQSNSPVISVTGTRFVPIFTEHPESVILNILKSIQLSSPNVQGDPITKITSTQQFADLLSDQQEIILKTTESLLPDAARPSFVNRMIECVRKGNFLVCSRDVLWPTLSEYFPRLSSFPDFSGHPQASKSISPQNLTDTSPFSETDVKIGQHGDATVTITDTRFYPVFSEHPEGVILRILKAVQHSTPELLYSTAASRLPETMTHFTEQQTNIVQVAESLLPESVRQVFVERMVMCVRENSFLDCTRDIAWPTIAQFFPRLPNFPNFGSYQNLPRTKLDLSSILLRNAYSENQTSDEKSQEDTPKKTTKEIIEDKVESVLKELVDKDTLPRLENSYLDADNPAIGSLLTTQEMNIIKLTEKAIPDPLRRAYVTNMLECVRSNNFITCTQHVSWPTVRQFVPTLPGFDDLFGQIPGISQLPDFVGQIPSFPGLPGNPFGEGPSIPQFPPQFPSQITGIPGQIQGGISQIPGFPSFGGISIPQFGILSDAPQESPQQQEQTILQSRISHTQQTHQISGIPVAANTPSVDNPGTVSGYLGQPSDILIDISKEKIHLSDIEQQRSPSPESVPTDPSFAKHERRRRSTEQLSNYYYETDGQIERTSQTMENTFPNITESEFLQLLVNISRSKKTPEEKSEKKPKEHFVDTLNSTIRNSLTADQYEILKIVENLNEHTASRGFLSQVMQCIASLSFIRCMGIFVWPVITSTVPSLIGLPSLPSIPGLGLIGRSIDTEVENFFGMSTIDFEKELLMRRESMENMLLDWHRKLMEGKFETNVGFLKIKGYGNGEVGISLSGSREGRATKIKDNKNLPSILTIISDIMEEVLDQRPDNEKLKKEKEKRERSLDDMQEADFQFLKESDEYADIKRSINDDQIITMFLNKIKANATDFADGDVKQLLNMEDAYNAFGVLFGTRLNEKFANRFKAFTEEHLRNLKDDPKNHMKHESSTEELKTIPPTGEIPYDLEKEFIDSQEERKREHRTKSELKSLLDKYTDKFVENLSTEKIDDHPDNENKIKDTVSPAYKHTRSELRIQLPQLQEDVISRKITSTMAHLGRALKMKMGTVLPGIGFIISFLIQVALAHAKAAASMAGIISNMALASAVFGMIRQSLFGPDSEPKIKYVYDNDKTGPGITWPHYESHHHHHHGKQH